jgi:hypothetical protein
LYRVRERSRRHENGVERLTSGGRVGESQSDRLFRVDCRVSAVLLVCIDTHRPLLPMGLMHEAIMS